MTDVGACTIVAAFASLGAAATHFAVAPSHFTSWPLSGVFFLATAAFQTGWALAVLRGASPRTMKAGLLVNAGAILLWALSRTAGFPVGPHANVPEQVDRVDLTTVAFEVAVCLLALWSFRARHARGFRSSFSAAVMIGVVGAGVTGFAMPAVELAGSHGHSHGPEVTDESVPHSHGSDEEDPAVPHGSVGGTTNSPPPAGNTPEQGQSPQPAPSHSHAPGTAPHDD
ncbi:hypothetical protein [Pseudofrankia sp. BMG5.36]|uniref:hypothetical protein n=1 Tax=Pseudofrankia sp. BMG5.36 TaxID=1834512 RepID=UPI0008DA4BE5|nr:hypothetical protein [Pseudofrankia sp. BMG5.36]OHV73042.1 hypothetical protein BCD48_33830 [Pseudofrankia sp. BMG5.36]